MFGKEILRPRAKRDPLVPAFSRIAVLCALVDEHRLDGKPVVCLNQHVFCDSKSLSVLDERRGIIDGGAEVAGCSLSVLDRKPVVATFPFQTLMSYAECVSIA